MIAVTGGVGFIGTNVTLKLLEKGHEVIVFDTLDTSWSGIADMLSHAGAKVEKGSAYYVVTKNNIDAIVHLGMPSSSQIYRENPNAIARVIDNFVSILEYVRKYRIPLVYASTSSVYNARPPPHRECDEVLPLDIYSESRYYIERLAATYQNLYGVKSIGLRFFSVYGFNEYPKGKYANIISQIILSSLFRESIAIYGDGKQTRDFIHVSDVVNAILIALESKESGVFNVGTGKETSFNEVVELISRFIPVRTEYIPNPIQNYVFRTRADTELAEKVLGFKARVELEYGIKKTIETYLEFFSADKYPYIEELANSCSAECANSLIEVYKKGLQI